MTDHGSGAWHRTAGRSRPAASAVGPPPARSPRPEGCRVSATLPSVRRARCVRRGVLPPSGTVYRRLRRRVLVRLEVIRLMAPSLELSERTHRETLHHGLLD